MVIMDEAQPSLVAVDIGNSQIKFGHFSGIAHDSIGERRLSIPSATFDLSVEHDSGVFDVRSLAAWCAGRLSPATQWLVGSVHRRAAAVLMDELSHSPEHVSVERPPQLLTYRDLPIEVRVDEPARVGIDRLLAAVAANHLRVPERPAVVIDLGTAITVDLVEADGGFAGGAILPGIGMAGRALAEQTDALPRVVLTDSQSPPEPFGKSTKAAIEAGLYWGAVGAVNELIAQLAARKNIRPDVFLTGGAGRFVLSSIAREYASRYEPHLVLAGIALLQSRAS